MTAKELIKAGRLSEARRVLTEEVKNTPADAGARTLLFQVLSLHGEWDKALRHLDMISTQDPQRSIGVKTYLDVVQAEKERIRVMGGSVLPSVLPEPPAYFAQYLDYLKALREQKYGDARSLVTELASLRPPVTGSMGAWEFEGFSDTDAGLFAFLEAFVHERYVWIPFEAIRELQIFEPKTSFDLIWATASITTWEGLSMNCCLPVLYPETFLAADEQIKIGRLTDWVPLGSGLSKAYGQHVYQIGDEDTALLDIREVTFKLEGA
ncbi:MAG TPA: type VI secretion system accessory protein TagJ [Desulfomonilia bacterium]|nr:type VI secretion system accessory protein TagJ [Desulfomonilia bacterium]